MKPPARPPSRLGTGEEAPDFKDEDYPLPPGCERFILPMQAIKSLRAHPLSQGLYPCVAGFYRDDSRRYDCGALAYDLLYFCTKGGITLLTADSSYPVNAGDLVVVPAGTPHVTQASDSRRWSFFFTTYSGALSAEYTAFLRAPHLVNHVGLDPDLIAEFNALCALRQSDFALDTLVAGSTRMAGLLTRLARALARQAQAAHPRIQLEGLRHAMAQHLDGSLDLNALAASVNLSPFHFARLFKKLTGTSPIRYYIQMRIQHACHLLDSTHKPIQQIASEVGYDLPAYFTKIFRQVVGVTPSVYRNWNGHT